MTRKPSRPAEAAEASLQEVHDEAPSDGRHGVTIDLLAQQMHETVDKLIADGASRADVKLLTTALKELRYSFKVFAAYRHVPKVTVFGSARLSADSPAYQQA